MSRKEAYNKVKELGLTKAIAKKYKKNFTMCKTTDLIAEIESATKSTSTVKEVKEVKKAPTCKKAANSRANVEEDKASQAITLLTNKLVNNGILSSAEGTEVVELLGTTLTIVPDAYSSEEIDDMFEDM